MGKTKIINREKDKEERQKLIRTKRQQIRKALEKLNNLYKKRWDKTILRLGALVDKPNMKKQKMLLNDIRRKAKLEDKVIERYKNFWVKNWLYIDRYLFQCQYLFQPQEEKNEKDTALWFNLEDIKNANDLRQCWSFIRELKTYFFNYKKLMWGEKTGRKAIYEKMWSEIRDYYYKRLKRNKKDKAKRYEIYEIIAEKFNKEYKSLLPGKHPPVPQEDAFWRKFYSIKDKYRKAHCNKN